MADTLKAAHPRPCSASAKTSSSAALGCRTSTATTATGVLGSSQTRQGRSPTPTITMHSGCRSGQAAQRRTSSCTTALSDKESAIHLQSICCSQIAFHVLRCHPLPYMLLNLRFCADSIPSALTIPFKRLRVTSGNHRTLTVGENVGPSSHCCAPSIPWCSRGRDARRIASKAIY